MKSSIRGTAVVAAVLLGVPIGCGRDKPAQPTTTQSSKVSTGRATDESSVDVYRTHSSMTDPGKNAKRLAAIPNEPAAMVKCVQGLLMHGGLCWLYKHEPSKEQLGGESIHRAEAMLDRIAALDDRALVEPRPLNKRLIGNCRTFAVLLTSVMREKGIPARVRAGFATYTWGRGKFENHWICEYYDSSAKRWIRVDAQIDDRQRDLMKIGFNTLDMPEGAFLAGGSGWQDCSNGKTKPEDYGLGGPKGWNPVGWGMVRGTLLTDIMALNKVEVLPWDTNELGNKDQSALTEEEVKLLNRLAEVSISPDKDFKAPRSLFLGSPSCRMPPGWNPS